MRQPKIKIKRPFTLNHLNPDLVRSHFTQTYQDFLNTYNNIEQVGSFEQLYQAAYNLVLVEGVDSVIELLIPLLYQYCQTHGSIDQILVDKIKDVLMYPIRVDNENSVIGLLEIYGAVNLMPGTIRFSLTF